MTENKKFIIDGEVKERYFRYGFLYVVGITALINVTPVALIRFEPMRSSVIFAVFTAVWYLWLFATILWVKKYNLFGFTFVWVQLLFPIAILNFLLSRMVISLLMKKYPNSYDEDEIARFNRKLKIKSIL